jgi:5-methylcytosine-specific restriction endonuclease McrA
MITKKKICSACLQETFLFKSTPVKLCKSCYQKSYSKPIKKVSDKHKETLKEYKVVKEEFLKKYTTCQIKLSPDCTYDKGIAIHHIIGKSSKELYLDKNNFIACCNPCNLHLELFPNEAYEKGFKLHKNQINE